MEEFFYIIPSLIQEFFVFIKNVRMEMLKWIYVVWDCEFQFKRFSNLDNFILRSLFGTCTSFTVTFCIGAIAFRIPMASVVQTDVSVILRRAECSKLCEMVMGILRTCQNNMVIGSSFDLCHTWNLKHMWRDNWWSVLHMCYSRCQEEHDLIVIIDRSVEGCSRYNFEVGNDVNLTFL